MSIQTIDLDTNDKEVVDRVFRKILNRPCCKCLFFSHSWSKGVHFVIKCWKNCDLCRFVFDDETRYFYDQFRPEHSRNVLFQKYEPIKLKVKT